MTGQRLAVVGEDSWWRRVSSSLSADFFNGRFFLAYFLCLGGYVQKILFKLTPFSDVNKTILSGDVNKYKDCSDSAIETTEIDARWKTAATIK
jgi:hypothetical protein